MVRLSSCLIGLLVVWNLAAQTEPPPPPSPSGSIVIRQPTPEEKPVTASIGLKALTWEVVEPMIRPLLSPKGTAGYFAARHTVIVHDQQQIVDQIRKLIQTADSDPVNIRIEVQFLTDTLQTHGSLNVQLDHRREGPSITIEDGRVQRPRDVQVTIRDRQTETSRTNTMTLMTLSGSPARLWVGKSIPDPAFLKQYRLLPVTVVFTPGGAMVAQSQPAELLWRDVGNALYIRPTYMQNELVHIELFPVVTFIDNDGRERHFTVQEVKTEVYAKPGQRVLLGGNSTAMNRYLHQLFGPTLQSDTRRTSDVDMYVTPHVRIMRRPAE